MIITNRRPAHRPPMIFQLVWLIYMAYPIVMLLHRPAGEMALGFGILAVFAGLYVHSFQRISLRLTLVFAQLAIIVYFVWRYDPGFFYMAFYPSPVIGLLQTKRKIAAGFAALIVFLLGVYWFNRDALTSDDLLQVLPAMVIMLAMPIIIRFRHRAAELREKLNLANEEIARLSANEERQRISRDLHDTLGHTLSLITLKSELAEKLIGKNPARAAQEVRDIQATSRAALKQVRELVSGMNAATVRDELAHAKRILAAAGIVLDVKGDYAEGAASPLIDNILGMCLRESVTNVVKHSRARSCSVECAAEPDCLKLVVTDDGEGMNEAQAACMTEGNGLKGMRERLKLVEGEVQFETGKGRGTRVVFTVPRVNKSVVSGERSE